MAKVLPQLSVRRCSSQRELRSLVGDLGKSLGIGELGDWYQFQRQKALQPHEHLCHHGSLLEALRTVYPHHPWELSKFRRVPRKFWKDPKNQRDFMDWLGKHLGMGNLADWYHVTYHVMVKHGAKGILSQHSMSVAALLSAVYPEHSWQLWRFPQVPRGYWDRLDNKKDFVEWLSRRLKVNRLEDWYRVSLDHITGVAPVTLFLRHGGLAGVLTAIYPTHQWDVGKLNPRPHQVMKSSQWRLRRTVEELFPGLVVHEDYCHDGMSFSSGKMMQLDVFVPGLNLAFEYQGRQHFGDVNLFGAQKDILWRDSEKRTACSQKGITLIEIPYWWDFQKESLAGTVTSRRPEIALKSAGKPIPTRP